MRSESFNWKALGRRLTSIVRYHRAFLVNITHVVSVKGNSQGYKLSFPGLADEVPVSRAYTREVKSSLEQM